MPWEPHRFTETTLAKMIIGLTKQFRMSLFTPADGILKTNLTWDQLQKSVWKAFGKEAIFGPNKDVKDIGIGNGVMSRICLISPDWQAGLKEVPKNFIVKICSQLPVVENKAIMEHSEVFNEGLIKQLEDHVKKNHNTEVHLYELLKRYDVTDIPTPEVYFTQEFTEDDPLNGYFIMEYIGDGTLYHLFDNVTPEDMAQVMRALAKLQAAAVKFTDEEKAHFQTHPYLALFATLLNEQAASGFVAMLRQFAGEQLKDKVDQLEAALPEIADVKLVEEMPKSLGMEPVLCHGDLWATNLIWKNGKSDVELKAVIDFQNAHLGCPSVDVVRVFSACLSAKDRRDHWESLLEKLYTYLEEEMAGHSMPYTLEMLKTSYRLFFPLGAFLMLPMFGPTFQLVNSNTDVEYKAKTCTQTGNCDSLWQKFKMVPKKNYGLSAKHASIEPEFLWHRENGKA
ncbi:hypothetical protein TELCIR_00430 [Teladorsagia circumcincta]|uniref:CHK kinase-like domain-containing protein n=1 Tax=Teladorsagia circumcincta TaxID=45464 RepID=A0A2G9V4Q7_TELCI|nr:hypothetical protein TELCIR_00430 [Teladorsagia circumcincta]